MTAIRPPRSLFALMAVIVVVTVLLYARTARYGFINYDDYHYVVNNPHVAPGLSLSSVRWAITTGYFSYWHPVTWLGYLTLVTLFGPSPGPIHVANFLIHAANAAVLLYLLWRMTGSVWRSALVAAVFAWHPLRVETVVWISEYKGNLNTLFLLLTLLAYVRYAERPRLTRYLLVLVCYLLGLATKPMLVTLPGVLLLLDYWPLGRTRWLPREEIPRATTSRLVLEKIPMLLMAVGVAVLAVKMAETNYAMSTEVDLPLRLQNALVALTRYLAKLFWPIDMAVFYPHPGLVVGGRIGLGIAIVAACVFIALTVASLVLARRKPYLLVGWLWMIGVLLPMIGIIQAGRQAMADRYSNNSLIFITVAVVWLIGEWVGSRPSLKPLVASVTAVALVALLVKTSIQIGHWRDDASLFSHALRVTKANYVAHSGIGYVYYQQDRLDEAIAHYRAGLKFRPNDPLTNTNMGKALQRQGRLKEAEASYRRAIRYSQPDADLHNNLANILAGQGKTDEAIEHHEAATRIGAEFAHTHYNYGVTLAAAGRLKDAQARLERALQLKPEYPDARYAYGLVMARLGYEVAAADQLREANFLRSDWFEALRNLAWLLATSPDERVRNGAQAVIIAERANQLSGFDDAVALDTLAAAYAQAGRFDAAVASASRAEQLARSRGKNELADRSAARGELYRAGKPFHRAAAAAGATTEPFTP